MTKSVSLWLRIETQAPSTLIRFQTKTELFCSGYGYRPHYNAENDHRKRSHSKTLSRVEWFENDAFWKRYFLVWTVKTMLSENGGVIKTDTTVRQTTRPWVSKMVDRRYHVASISRQFCGPIYWNAHASSSFDHAHWGYNSVFKQIRRCSVDGRKRYENDKCGRKSFWKRSKTAPFSFENGLVWTGPQSGIKASAATNLPNVKKRNTSKLINSPQNHFFHHWNRGGGGGDGCSWFFNFNWHRFDLCQNKERIKTIPVPRSIVL